MSQVPTKLDVAIANVTRAQKALAALAAERAVQTRSYETQLAEIDQLKRQKASWRRDRSLRSKLAASSETSTALTALADRVRRADADLARAKAAAVVAIDAALPTAGVRRGELERRRLSYAPPAPAKKIILPDDALDPLADPEELDEQVAALREAEAALTAEVTRLDRRARRFDEQAELRKQHERAESIAMNEDDDVRRVAVRPGGNGVAAAEGSSAPPTDGAFDTPPPSGRDLATTLGSVVDARTVDVLRQSDRSSDPSTWAAAARQAKDAVTARLDTMRKRRLAIEARARELRKP